MTNAERDALLIRLDERIRHLHEKMPTVEAKVEKLESARDWLWGAGGGVTFIGSLAEYFLHKK